MSLHARVVARAAGATGDMVEQVAREISILGDINADRAKQIVDRLRRSDATEAKSKSDFDKRDKR
jgi:hydroxymethylglutaryl-CoA reductase